MDRFDREKAGGQPSEDQMTQEYAFDMSGQGIKKMPAADPGVRRAAEAMLGDPASYFAHQGEQARQEARQELEQRLARLSEQNPPSDLQERPIKRVLGWLAYLLSGRKE